jgi:hypothetical protein
MNYAEPLRFPTAGNDAIKAHDFHEKHADKKLSVRVAYDSQP